MNIQLEIREAFCRKVLITPIRGSCVSLYLCTSEFKLLIVTANSENPFISTADGWCQWHNRSALLRPLPMSYTTSICKRSRGELGAEFMHFAVGYILWFRTIPFLPCASITLSLSDTVGVPDKLKGTFLGGKGKRVWDFMHFNAILWGEDHFNPRIKKE